MITHTLPTLFYGLMRLIWRDLAQGELNLRAMSLVFTTLLSLVPMIAVAFSVLKAFGVHNQLSPFLLTLLEPLGEKGPELTAQIIGFVQNIQVGVLGFVGLAMLFYTIISLVQKIEQAFNYVWQVEQIRPLARRFTDYLSVVMIGPVMVVAIIGMTGNLFQHHLVQQIGEATSLSVVFITLSQIVPYIMMLAVLTLLYRFIPNTKVKLLPAVLGALFAAGLWILIGSAFAYFVASSSSYTAIYSSFAILFFFILWFYLMWLILLVGSQVAFYSQYPVFIRRTDYQRPLSIQDYEQLGMMIMLAVSQRFYQQQTALEYEQLITTTGISHRQLDEVLAPLLTAKLLVVTEAKGKSYQPGRDIAMITLADVLITLRQAKNKRELTWPTSSLMTSYLAKAEQAQLELLTTKTLRQIIMDDIDAER